MADQLPTTADYPSKSIGSSVGERHPPNHRRIARADPGRHHLGGRHTEPQLLQTVGDLVSGTFEANQPPDLHSAQVTHILPATMNQLLPYTGLAGLY